MAETRAGLISDPRPVPEIEAIEREGANTRLVSERNELLAKVKTQIRAQQEAPIQDQIADREEKP